MNSFYLLDDPSFCNLQTCHHQKNMQCQDKLSCCGKEELFYCLIKKWGNQNQSFTMNCQKTFSPSAHQ
ncbi:hypothetical protein V6N12_029684 [Hibiscus sabdariffa]|uniref:Uncharacterized protein n=1 Tax=Hibiscus sabdariffa TaxID=183260 RepID=A0ABR2CWU7_9ROSI